VKEIKLEENIDKLKTKFNMSHELIDKLLLTNPHSYHPIELSTLLATVDETTEEERVCTVIESLHHFLGLNYETLAAFGEIDIEELNAFLKDPFSLPEKKKYRLSVRMMFIHFVLKEKYQMQ